MSEITKGTWKVSGRYVIAKQNIEDYVRICEIFTSDADAQLIASANNLKQQRDDLLAACENVVKIKNKIYSLADVGKVIKQLEAAMAKANTKA